MRRLSFLFFAYVALHVTEAAHSEVLSSSWSSPAFDLSDGVVKAQAPRISISSDGTKATAVWSRGDTARVPQSASATITGNSAIWSTPINLSANLSVSPTPQVSLSSDGTKATAVWSGPSGVIQASSATISGNSAIWSSPINLSGTSASQVQVSLSSDGTRATAVWKRTDGSNYLIQASSATMVGNLATWSAPVDLYVSSQEATNPDVSISSDGSRATAAWDKVVSSTNRVAQSSSATIVGNLATWSSPIDLSSSSQQNLVPNVSLSGDGAKALVVWSFGSNVSPTTYVAQATIATIVGSSASWSSPVNLSMPSADLLSVRALLSSDGTKATAVFSFFDGTNGTIQASSCTIVGNTATWATPVNLSVLGQNSTGANIGLSSDGSRATAIWQNILASSVIIQASSAEIIGNFASWTSPIDVSTGSTLSGSTVSNTRLAVSGEGTVATGIWQAGNPTVIKTATALITYPARIPSLSEWTQLLLALMAITIVGWHFHRERRY